MTDVGVRVRVGEEHYALPVEHVLEVAELGALEPVPGAPASVLGVRNLRGQVVPVLDAAALLGVEHRAQPRRIVIVEAGGRRAGLAVDALTDVAPLPEATEPREGRALAGAALVDGTLVGIVDVPALLDAVEAQVAA